MNVLKQGNDEHGFYTYLIQYEGTETMYFVTIRRRNNKVECPALHEMRFDSHTFEPYLSYVSKSKRRAKHYKHLIDGAKRYVNDRIF